MPRSPREIIPGQIYHVLNRAAGALRIFDGPRRYNAFEEILSEARHEAPIRILAYCIMPTHWHMVVWPEVERDLSRFAKWVTQTHTRRLHAERNTAGAGPIYQGRFKSFVVQSDLHCLTVCRYVEQNPLRAGLVRRAQDWQWGSLWRRTCGGSDQRSLLTDGSVGWPDNWLDTVNDLQPRQEVNRLRTCVQRDWPFGDKQWMLEVTAQRRRERR